MWQNVLRAKYIKNGALSQCSRKANQSHFWQGLMNVSPISFRFCRKVIGNGERTLFWEDTWLGQKPIRELFPRLYLLTFYVNITVSKVFSEGWGVIRFQRILFGETAKMWQDL
jgi:hypothetical protein